MRPTRFRLARLLLIGFVLALGTPSAAEARPQAEVRETASTERKRPPAAPPSDPVAGCAIIAGAIALLVLMAWVAARMGDDATRS